MSRKTIWTSPNSLPGTNGKTKTEHGLSTNEIVELGNLCELTSLNRQPSKLDQTRYKDLMGHPELGKNIPSTKPSSFSLYET
ncbi:hypothetical protein PO124_33740 [Bacillus licheniformis]|nr:hypothetical protein [Bacillus licheniformis]